MLLLHMPLKCHVGSFLFSGIVKGQLNTGVLSQCALLPWLQETHLCNWDARQGVCQPSNMTGGKIPGFRTSRGLF